MQRTVFWKTMQDAVFNRVYQVAQTNSSRSGGKMD